MKIGYKLTDSKNQTFRGTKWGEGITHTSKGVGQLCTSGWIHFYDSPELAVLLNPIHGNFNNPNLWRIKYSGKTLNDRGLKRGATSVTTIERITLPEYSVTQKVAFGILCVRYISKDKSWRKWADGWLSGKDRSSAAYAASSAASYAVYAASSAASYADYAASYASSAAYAASSAASYADYAARSADYAARSASYASSAAYAASSAASSAAAAVTTNNIPLKSLAKKALTYV